MELCELLISLRWRVALRDRRIDQMGFSSRPSWAPDVKSRQNVLANNRRAVAARQRAITKSALEPRQAVNRCRAVMKPSPQPIRGNVLQGPKMVLLVNKRYIKRPLLAAVPSARTALASNYTRLLSTHRPQQHLVHHVRPCLSSCVLLRAVRVLCPCGRHPVGFSYHYSYRDQDRHRDCSGQHHHSFLR